MPIEFIPFVLVCLMMAGIGLLGAFTILRWLAKYAIIGFKKAIKWKQSSNDVT